MKDILLLGSGGHCRSCIDVIEVQGAYNIRGIVCKEYSATRKVLGYPEIGTDVQLAELLESVPNALITIGQIANSEIRETLFALLVTLEANLPSIAARSSYVSKRSSIGSGTIVMHHSVINAVSEVGRNCIINTGALIEHDCIVADHCHISTGVRVNGGVFVGEGTFIGSGAVIREGVKIGQRCVIGAGSIVLKDIADGTTFFRRDSK